MSDTPNVAASPIPLTAEQIKAVQEWAADEWLWASRATTEFNLFTFARVILKAEAEARGVAQALEMRVMELEMDRYVPGQMVCDACKFALTTTILDVAHGRMGAPIAPRDEPCPNGCGPLRPLTWREDVKRADASMMKSWEALEESVWLQSHYAELLNMHDGGHRMTFDSPAAWMNRLDALKGK